LHAEQQVNSLETGGVERTAARLRGVLAIVSQYSVISKNHKLLLDKGADVNAQGGKYGTALYAAASEGQADIVQLLLDKDADVNAQVGSSETALQAAAWTGRADIIQLLLDKGADINA
jgi:ankyrin repeat protein